MKQIHSIEQLSEAINDKGLVFVLKHSSTCPISHAAFGEYEKFTLEQPNSDCFFLTVQDARSVSDYIAEQFHIKHESPQVIMFKNNEVNWHASHWKITKTALSSVLKENS